MSNSVLSICSTPGFPLLHYLLKFAQLISIELVMPFNHLILCHSLVFLLSIFPSIRVFSSGESALHNRWPKNWAFSSKPSNEYSGLISFRVGWFDLLLSKELYKSKKYYIIVVFIVNARLPIYSSLPPFPFGKHKFVFESLSLPFFGK